MTRPIPGSLAAAVLTLALVFGAAGVAGAQTLPAATAELRDGAAQPIGTATFTQTAEGIVVSGQLRGLTPGLHAVHIHEVGRCDAPFTSAGEHWNPMSRQHGVNNPAGTHVADLYSQLEPAIGSNVRAGADGSAPLRGVFRLATLTSGALSVFDADGSALVVHAMPDDNASDPAGNAGGRVACAVIVAGPGSLPRTGQALPAGTLAGMGAGLVTLAALLGLTHRKRRGATEDEDEVGP